MPKRPLPVALSGLLLLATLAAADDGKVHRIKILADKAPDFSSRKALVDSVTHGLNTNDARAIAIYNLGRYAWYHHAYPGEPGGISALKYLNVYGWGLCGGQHSVLCSLWEAAGFDTRFIGWKGHTTVECRYDEQWHYFDTFMKCFFWKDDPGAPGGRTVASQADIEANPAIVNEGLVFDKTRNVWYFKGDRFENIGDDANWTALALFVCGDQPKWIHSGVKGRGNPSEANKKRGHMGIGFDEKGYSTDVNLGPGMSLELMWKALPDAWYWHRMNRHPCHSCRDKDFRNCPVVGPILEPYIGVYANGGQRTYANGKYIFAPDLSSDAFLAGLAAAENVKVAGGRIVPSDPSKPASITVELQLPYVFTTATGSGDGIDKAEFSADGQTFEAIELKDFTNAVRGKYKGFLRLTTNKGMKDLRVEVIVQHNRCSLPYLSPGRNEITVSVADPKQLGQDHLAVTYAYSLGSRDWSQEKFADRGYEVARGHKAAWSDEVTVVQKVFSAKDLPATFTIDCPTPKDKQVVYPRMHFIRREVLSPGQKPMPLPQGAVEPTVGKNEELKTLPYPFHMGTDKPPAKIVRPTKTTQLPLSCSHVVDFENNVHDNHWIKTRPKVDEWWIMLVGGELNDLPKAGDIARAAVCIPVTMTHSKANVRVGILSLRRPFEKDKPYAKQDFGGVLSSSVLPKQQEPGPAKCYKLDVTRYLKDVSAGDTQHHGFAIKVLPDRSVDDGWTVRIDITKDEPTFLEMDVHQAGT